MNIFELWADVLSASFKDLWMSFIDFLPNFLGAIVILIIGWIIAVILGGVVRRVVDFLKVDELLEKLSVSGTLKKGGVHLNVAGLLGWLVKWFLIIVFLIAAADIMRWTQINEFLTGVVLYLPNVIISIIIILAGIVLADFINEIIKKAVMAAELKSAQFLAGIAKWAILIFTFMAALVQLRIADQLIQTLFTGFVAMLAIGGGLAFGLGGQDHAKKFIEALRKDLSEK